MKRISLSTTIEQVLNQYPEAIEFFEKKGMYCTNCKGKKNESINYASMYYGYSPEEFLKELKEFIKKSSSKLKKVK